MTIKTTRNVFELLLSYYGLWSSYVDTGVEDRQMIFLSCVPRHYLIECALARCLRSLSIIDSVLWSFTVIKLIGNFLRIERLFMQKYFIVGKESDLAALGV